MFIPVRSISGTRILWAPEAPMEDQDDAAMENGGTGGSDLSSQILAYFESVSWKWIDC